VGKALTAPWIEKRRLWLGANLLQRERGASRKQGQKQRRISEGNEMGGACLGTGTVFAK
jgi:hypothetical protein